MTQRSIREHIELKYGLIVKFRSTLVGVEAGIRIIGDLHHAGVLPQDELLHIQFATALAEGALARRKELHDSPKH